MAKRTISYTGPFFLDERKTEAGVDGKVKKRIKYDVRMSIPPKWKGETEVGLLEMWEKDGEWCLTLAPDRYVEIGGVEREVKIVSRRGRNNADGELKRRKSKTDDGRSML